MKTGEVGVVKDEKSAKHIKRKKRRITIYSSKKGGKK